MEEDRLYKKRAIDNPYDKKTSAKALSTLGYDILHSLSCLLWQMQHLFIDLLIHPSLHRSMKLLGLKEDALKQALMEESARLELSIANSRRNLASYDPLPSSPRSSISNLLLLPSFLLFILLLSYRDGARQERSIRAPWHLAFYPLDPLYSLLVFSSPHRHLSSCCLLSRERTKQD